MNTNHLKKFAQEARRKLLEQVGAKLHFVLTTDSAELREKTEQLKQLRQELSRTSKEQLIEKVAYTWFNRLMALRFMDVNDYQPLGIRIITPKDGYTTPELLDEAKRGNIPDEIKVYRQKIYDLLDNRIPSKNSQNEAFKELLIAACNHLHTIFPFLYERINDYTELLLPDDLTSDFSIVKDVREGMPVDDCRNVEIIGWLYQFYISEKKDEVFASKSKIKREDIPAATQLFTPRWIVEYMVQNTLGKLWLQNRPKSRLREHMPYFIKSASLEAEDYLKINSPEEIKFLDPASGSGHILVYAFDLFMKIYEEEGYNANEIPQLIIEKNLYGFEIDERAVQLTGLALMMKAREYHRRVFHKEHNPNILCFKDLIVSTDEIKNLTKTVKIHISDELMHDLLLMQHATNFGSLIIPHTHTIEIESALNKLTNFLPTSDVFQRNILEELVNSLKQLLLLAQKFHCLVANPPYMGDGNMNLDLSRFVKTYYPLGKADLMACFMESGIAMLQADGFLGMINQHSWMFLSSYADLRNKLINDVRFNSLLHLGARTFPEISGEVVKNAAFVIQKALPKNECIFIKLDLFNHTNKKQQNAREAIEATSSNIKFAYNVKNFLSIPSATFSYWISKRMVELLAGSKIGDYLISDGQILTGNNDKFLRYLWEVKKQSIVDDKWRLHTKGGDKRKWSGNIDRVVKWDSDTREYYRNNSTARILSSKYWNRTGIVWNGSSGTGNFGVRLLKNNESFNKAAPCIFLRNCNDDEHYYIGILNSTITKKYLSLLSGSNYNSVEDVLKIPCIKGNNTEEVKTIVKENIDISSSEWNTRETSWDYKTNELIKIGGEELNDTYAYYESLWQNKISKLHSNEELLNKLIIEDYGLQNEIESDISVEEISLFKEDTQIENNRVVFQPSVVFNQFLSFFIGCSFGRFSLDKKGQILANQSEKLEDYLQYIEKQITQCAFLPDEDNIIPILDNEWFEDDIVGRFYHFLKVSFGEKNFNTNLAFIEEQIGKDIRKYFTKDFYPDHIKRYKKRPIYWLFSSPKGSFNVLIYMHRYTPDTVSNILNKYLKEFIGKLNTRKEHLEHVQVTGSASEKTKAIKEIDNIIKILVELHEYERDILYPLAIERIEIDLDDGVLVNYNKFGRAVKEVNGLNDPATKKKVKQFDWINTSQIR